MSDINSISDITDNKIVKELFPSAIAEIEEFPNYTKYMFIDGGLLIIYTDGSIAGCNKDKKVEYSTFSKITKLTTKRYVVKKEYDDEGHEYTYEEEERSFTYYDDTYNETPFNSVTFNDLTKELNVENTYSDEKENYFVYNDDLLVEQAIVPYRESDPVSLISTTNDTTTGNIYGKYSEFEGQDGEIYAGNSYQFDDATQLTYKTEFEESISWINTGTKPQYIEVFDRYNNAGKKTPSYHSGLDHFIEKYGEVFKIEFCEGPNMDDYPQGVNDPNYIKDRDEYLKKLLEGDEEQGLIGRPEYTFIDINTFRYYLADEMYKGNPDYTKQIIVTRKKPAKSSDNPENKTLVTVSKGTSDDDVIYKTFVKCLKEDSGAPIDYDREYDYFTIIFGYRTSEETDNQYYYNVNFNSTYYDDTIVNKTKLQDNQRVETLSSRYFAERDPNTGEIIDKRLLDDSEEVVEEVTGIYIDRYNYYPKTPIKLNDPEHGNKPLSKYNIKDYGDILVPINYKLNPSGEFVPVPDDQKRDLVYKEGIPSNALFERTKTEETYDNDDLTVSNNQENYYTRTTYTPLPANYQAKYFDTVVTRDDIPEYDNKYTENVNITLLNDSQSISEHTFKCKEKTTYRQINKDDVNSILYTDNIASKNERLYKVTREIETLPRIIVNNVEVDKYESVIEEALYLVYYDYRDYNGETDIVAYNEDIVERYGRQYVRYVERKDKLNAGNPGDSTFSTASVNLQENTYAVKTYKRVADGSEIHDDDVIERVDVDGVLVKYIVTTAVFTIPEDATVSNESIYYIKKKNYRVKTAQDTGDNLVIEHIGDKDYVITYDAKKLVDGILIDETFPMLTSTTYEPTTDYDDPRAVEKGSTGRFYIPTTTNTYFTLTAYTDSDRDTYYKPNNGIYDIYNNTTLKVKNVFTYTPHTSSTELLDWYDELVTKDGVEYVQHITRTPLERKYEDYRSTDTSTILVASTYTLLAEDNDLIIDGQYYYLAKHNTQVNNIYYFKSRYYNIPSSDKALIYPRPKENDPIYPDYEGELETYYKFDNEDDIVYLYVFEEVPYVLKSLSVEEIGRLFVMNDEVYLRQTYEDLEKFIVKDDKVYYKEFVARSGPYPSNYEEIVESEKWLITTEGSTETKERIPFYVTVITEGDDTYLATTYCTPVQCVTIFTLDTYFEARDYSSEIHIYVDNSGIFSDKENIRYDRSGYINCYEVEKVFTFTDVVYFDGTGIEPIDSRITSRYASGTTDEYGITTYEFINKSGSTEDDDSRETVIIYPEGNVNAYYSNDDVATYNPLTGVVRIVNGENWHSTYYYKHKEEEEDTYPEVKCGVPYINDLTVSLYEVNSHINGSYETIVYSDYSMINRIVPQYTNAQSADDYSVTYDTASKTIIYDPITDYVTDTDREGETLDLKGEPIITGVFMLDNLIRGLTEKELKEDDKYQYIFYTDGSILKRVKTDGNLTGDYIYIIPVIVDNVKTEYVHEILLSYYNNITTFTDGSTYKFSLNKPVYFQTGDIPKVTTDEDYVNTFKYNTTYIDGNTGKTVHYSTTREPITYKYDSGTEQITKAIPSKKCQIIYEKDGDIIGYEPLPEGETVGWNFDIANFMSTLRGALAIIPGDYQNYVDLIEYDFSKYVYVVETYTRGTITIDSEEELNEFLLTGEIPKKVTKKKVTKKKKVTGGILEGYVDNDATKNGTNKKTKKYYGYSCVRVFDDKNDGKNLAKTTSSIYEKSASALDDARSTIILDITTMLRNNFKLCSKTSDTKSLITGIKFDIKQTPVTKKKNVKAKVTAYIYKGGNTKKASQKYTYKIVKSDITDTIANTVDDNDVDDTGSKSNPIAPAFTVSFHRQFYDSKGKRIGDKSNVIGAYATRELCYEDINTILKARKAVKGSIKGDYKKSDKVTFTGTEKLKTNSKTKSKIKGTIKIDKLNYVLEDGTD